LNFPKHRYNDDQNVFSGFRGPKVPISVIIGITAVRYIILPILGVGFIKCAVHFGAVNSDPLYKFVLLLQFALPPAINIGFNIHAKFNHVLIWRQIESVPN
jgi:predicted permease